jgi:hypothetical protein
MQVELETPNALAPLSEPDSPAKHKTDPPKPTTAPFFLALGIMMLLWGIVTSPVMSIGGFALLLVSLWKWIAAITNQWRQ